MKLKSPIVIPCLLTFHAISLHHRGNSERVFVFVFNFDPRGRCRAPSIPPPPHNDKNVSISLRYSPPLLWSASSSKYPRCGKDSKKRGTRTDTKGWKRRAFETFRAIPPSASPCAFYPYLPLGSLKLKVPRRSRCQVESLQKLPALPSFLSSSLSNLSRR